MVCPGLLLYAHSILIAPATTLVDSGKHCVGAATSRSVTGPYVATSDEPLFCPLSQGGAIDAAGFKDWSDRGWGWGPGPYTVPDTNVQVTSGSPAILTSSPGTNSWTNATYSQGGRGGKRYVVYKVDGILLAQLILMYQNTDHIQAPRSAMEALAATPLHQSSPHQ